MFCFYVKTLQSTTLNFFSLEEGGVSYEFNGLDWRNYLSLMISYGNSGDIVRKTWNSSHLGIGGWVIYYLTYINFFDL